MGFGQSRSEKRRKNAIHSFREVQVKKNDSRSRSESEMKKLRDREVKFLENLKIIPDILFLGSAPSSNGNFF